jgi:hypothetical protein
MAVYGRVWQAMESVRLIEGFSPPAQRERSVLESRVPPRAKSEPASVLGAVQRGEPSGGRLG